VNRHSGPNLDLQLDITVRSLLAIFLHVRPPQQEYAKTDLMGNLFINSTVGQYRKDLPSSNNSLVRNAKVSEISTMITMRTRIRPMVGNQTAEMQRLKKTCQTSTLYQIKAPPTAEGILLTTIWKWYQPQRLHQWQQCPKIMQAQDQGVRMRISISRHKRAVLSPIYALEMRQQAMP